MRTKAEIALILASFFWGLTFPLIRIITQEISPLQLVFLRSLIASLIFCPFIFFLRNNRKAFIDLIPLGALLGFLFFLSYFTQTIGLQTISSGRSAFITNLTVVFVPLLSPLFKRGFPTRYDLISCFIAMCGMYFLTDPFNNAGIHAGDLWTILCALCFSLQIHVLQWAMEKKPFDIIYAFLQVVFMTLFSLFLMPFYPTSPHFFPKSIACILSLIYLGIIATVVTTWLQTRYQRYTSPERASVIYILEPLFACFLGYIILNETMSSKNLFGGFLIILAVLWNYIFKFLKNRFSPPQE